MRLGHLDSGAGVFLQLGDGLTALADNGAGHHRRHQHLEVVRRLHCWRPKHALLTVTMSEEDGPIAFLYNSK